MEQIIFINYLNKGFIMFKKAIFAFFVCGICLNAQMINGIAAIVENEPITLFEVTKVKEQLKIDEQKALDLLIRDRLEQAQIKTLGINVTPFEINERVDAIAKKNGVSTSQFRMEIENRGTRFKEFKNDIEKSLLQEKLYAIVFADIGKSINENSARRYYENNRAEFSSFKSTSIIVFSSDNMDMLLKQRASGVEPIDGVQSRTLNLNRENISPRLAVLIASTPEKSFTQPLQSPNGFDMFYVNAKNGLYEPSFEEIKNEVLSSMYQAEQERVAQDYFNKLRAKAKVNMIRQ